MGGGGHPVHFPASPDADQIQWGGGVVAEIFRDLHQPDGDQVQWGGVVADIFPVTPGVVKSNSLDSGAFFDISGAPGGRPPFMDTHANSGTLGRSPYTFKERNNINSLQKKNIYQKFGGPWPPWPPWLRHCYITL